MALLVEGRDGPVAIYVMEVIDVEPSISAARQSAHPIDADHKRIMGAALGAHVPSEVLLDLRP